MTSFTSNGIAYDREGPRGELPIVVIHAGVADRGMWDPIWPELTGKRDVVRVDLRGFGESAARPGGALSHPGDVLDTLAELGVARYHVVGSSFGAGVAVEVALARPSAVHDAAERVVAGIAGARRVDWPNAGHLPSLENPAAFAELLLEWVKDKPTAAG